MEALCEEDVKTHCRCQLTENINFFSLFLSIFNQLAEKRQASNTKSDFLRDFFPLTRSTVHMAVSQPALDFFEQTTKAFQTLNLLDSVINDISKLEGRAVDATRTLSCDPFPPSVARQQPCWISAEQVLPLGPSGSIL